MLSDSNTTQVFKPLHNLSPTDSSRGQLGSPPLSNDFMQLGFPRLDDYGDECPPRESTRTWVLRLPQRAKNESLNGTEGYCPLVLQREPPTGKCFQRTSPPSGKLKFAGYCVEKLAVTVNEISSGMGLSRELQQMFLLKTAKIDASLPSCPNSKWLFC
ncbi:hypothetical protein FB45DRAFT_1009525 [Roridomyces roridus]|uniref:Uncharacterized protein n=1 Tax=Roridomyces roridus TaxID=1738132 RepID=A0AAD7B6H9_9AGAR|nr:hypothetical protein FB45DRAFT_1009525 [Roridomyces roridus]